MANYGDDVLCTLHRSTVDGVFMMIRCSIEPAHDAWMHSAVHLPASRDTGCAKFESCIFHARTCTFILRRWHCTSRTGNTYATYKSCLAWQGRAWRDGVAHSASSYANNVSHLNIVKQHFQQEKTSKKNIHTDRKTGRPDTEHLRNENNTNLI